MKHSGNRFILAKPNPNRMVSLHSLAKELEVGDEIRWLSKRANIQNFQEVGLNVIDDVRRDGDRISVEATGPNGADVRFWVEKGANNQVLHGGTPQGEMEQAQVPRKDLLYVA